MAENFSLVPMAIEGAFGVICMETRLGFTGGFELLLQPESTPINRIENT